MSCWRLPLVTFGGWERKVVEAEERAQLFLCVVDSAAVGAVCGRAGDLAPSFDQAGGLGVLDPDPGWQYGVRACHAQPRDHVGQGLALGGGHEKAILHRHALAGPPGKPRAAEDQRTVAGRHFASQCREDNVHPHCGWLGSFIGGGEKEVQEFEK